MVDLYLHDSDDYNVGGRNQVEGATSVEGTDTETPVHSTKEVHWSSSRG